MTSCEPEKVTGYVDEALEAAARAEIEAHLASCAACRQQVDEERDLRARLRALPSPELRPAFEGTLRAALSASQRRRRFWALPLAASLAFLGLWARGAAPFVAYELVRDHTKCFGLARLPAKVWSDDPQVVAGWFEAQGTGLPLIPASAGGLGLVGARFCPLFDRFTAHVYYAEGERHTSLFVFRGPARFGDSYEARVGGQTVLLFRTAGATLGVVSERSEDAEALRRRFTTTIASLRPSGASAR
jgi:anti-sigma factor RsiW